MPVVGEGTVQGVRAAVGQQCDELAQQLALAGHDGQPVLGLHDVVGGDPLEHQHLQPGAPRHDQVGLVADERSRARGVGGVLDRTAETTDQVAGEVLQRGERGPAAVVGRVRPGAHRAQVGEDLVELVVGDAGQVGGVPLAQGRPDRGPVEPGQVDAAGDHAVLDVVDGVGDVVGEIHHLGLQAAAGRLGRRHAGPHPREDRAVVGVDAELAVAQLLGTPGVLRAGVQGGAGEVEPHRAPLLVEGLRLQAGQQPQRLGVALEAPALHGQVRQHALTVVPEGRVAQVVGQRRGLGDVGVRPERPGEVPGYLGHLQAVGEPVAHEVVALRTDDLGLGGEPT